MQSSCDKRRSEKQGEEMGGTFFDLDQRLEERLLVLLLERLQDTTEAGLSDQCHGRRQHMEQNGRVNPGKQSSGRMHRYTPCRGSGGIARRRARGAR